MRMCLLMSMRVRVYAHACMHASMQLNVDKE